MDAKHIDGTLTLRVTDGPDHVYDIEFRGPYEKFALAQAVPGELAARVVACWDGCIGINPEAVPSLLEALAECVEVLAGIRASFTGDDAIDLSTYANVALSRARAALAKARKDG